VDIAPDAVPGTYEGTIIVKPENSREWPVNVSLVIENNSLSDRGDGETWRHSRLRWLNSTLGIDYEPVGSYTPLVIDNRRISCLGRTVQLNNFGLPETITCWGNNILASPIKFVIQVNNRIVTFPEGKFIYVSPSCERITGRSADEFYRDPDLLIKLVHPDDRAVYMHHQNGHFNIGSGSGSIDFRILMVSGETRWISHHCQPVFGSNGAWHGRRASNRDITMRKRVEEALRESEAMLNSIFRSAPTGIGVVVDRVIINVNDRLCEMTGYSRDALVVNIARVL
jgi:PAS domain S-box-containing protein